MKKMIKRNINLDLIRVIAVISVICVHFFLNCGFYGEIILGKKTIIMVYLRTFFMICVPLFLLLTGYLMSNKKLEKKYYFGILKVIYVYVFSSVLCMLYKIFALKETFSLVIFIQSIFDFSGATYSWYINMYVGLFLLIPFLNLIYKNLETEKEKLMLIFTLLLITTIPTYLNAKFQILPNWWLNIYPITYYFIGNYLKEYSVRIKSWLNILMIFAFALLFGSICLYPSYNTTFVWGIHNDWGSITSVTLSVLVFIFILNLKLEKLPIFIKHCVKRISEVSLATYLLSFIFDNYYYSILAKKIPDVGDRLIYFPIIVILVFISSLIIALLIDYTKKLVLYLVEKRRKYE